jgi:hypothetical protein
VCCLARRLSEVLRRLYAGGIKWGFAEINNSLRWRYWQEMKETD